MELTVYRPEQPGRSPRDPDVRDAWLPRLGPTAWVILEELEERATSRPWSIDLEHLAALIGVKPSVCRSALVRLARFRVLFFEQSYGCVVSDGTLPR